MRRIYAYLRASTKEQDANRAKQALASFVANSDQQISGWFIENESGATLRRPELFRLLDVAQCGDILLVEQIDRISRLNTQDWETLKLQIKTKGIIILSIDLPTSHQFIMEKTDEFTKRMVSAINNMMIDMLAAIARKDYEDRKRRQSEGILKAKIDGKYKGRKINFNLHENIKILLEAGKSYTDIVNLLACSRSTISKIKKSISKP